MFKPSMVTFLHEFKHGLQDMTGKKNSEVIARGWSLSVFAQASPRHYNRAVARGLLFYN